MVTIRVAVPQIKAGVDFMAVCEPAKKRGADCANDFLAWRVLLVVSSWIASESVAVRTGQLSANC